MWRRGPLRRSSSRGSPEASPSPATPPSPRGRFSSIHGGVAGTVRFASCSTCHQLAFRRSNRASRTGERSRWEGGVCPCALSRGTSRRPRPPSISTAPKVPSLFTRERGPSRYGPGSASGSFLQDCCCLPGPTSEGSSMSRGRSMPPARPWMPWGGGSAARAWRGSCAAGEPLNRSGGLPRPRCSFRPSPDWGRLTGIPGLGRCFPGWMAPRGPRSSSKRP